MANPGNKDKYLLEQGEDAGQTQQIAGYPLDTQVTTAAAAVVVVVVVVVVAAAVR